MISLSTAYFPNTIYFALLASGKVIEIERHESFQKQSFRNRTVILNIDKRLDLIIPVKKGKKEELIVDTQIESRENWKHQHWGAIKSAYGRAPFFEHYADEVKALIYSQETRLFVLNSNVLTGLSRLIGISAKIQPTTNYEPSKAHLDLRGYIHPKKSLPSGAVLTYNQHFGNDFVGSLSILDLLFNEGPQSLSLLKQQAILILKELK
jgi:hypothetical protein